MRICCLLWVAFVTGCGSVVGGWKGDCEVQVGNDLYTYEVELEVESIEKGDINGTGTLYDEQNNRSQGTLDGSKEGSVLDFDIVAQQCTADALTGLRLYHRTIRAKILVG